MITSIDGILRGQKGGITAVSLFLPLVLVPASPCNAQRANENVVTSAEDAFGNTVGNESIGLYDEGSVRGFSPTSAGNVRIEGLYSDRQADLSNRVRSGSTIRVGLAAQGYPVPAPTGIVDISLRSSGDAGLVSVIGTVGPFGGQSAELDSQVRVADGVSTAAGVSINRDRFANGGRRTSISAGLVPRWRAGPHLEVVAFLDRTQTFGETSPPIYLTDGGFVPRLISRGYYPGPQWATSGGSGTNGGILAKEVIGSWTLRAGVFGSALTSTGSFANIVWNLAPDGAADRSVIAYPANGSSSLSGEFRVSRSIGSDERQSLVTLSVRGRDVSSRYGGSDEAQFGPYDPRLSLQVARPDFRFGELTRDKVTQTTFAAAYAFRWHDVGEVDLGIQRTTYTQTIRDPQRAGNKSTSVAWLPNASASLNLGAKIVAYGSYTKGLEESGTAPDFAANGFELLPALRTRQWDAGLRWQPRGSLTLILGYFDLRKPYFTLDRSNIFRQLGVETHRGVELSISAEPSPGLKIVAGALIGRPRVAGASDASELTGSRPVGQPDNIAQFNVDYDLRFFRGLSIDATMNYKSSQAGSVDNAAIVSGYATVDVGLRYRILISKPTVTLRVVVSNAVDHNTWVVLGPSAYEPLNQRTVYGSLSADF